jgi:hypothetical protein
MEHTVPFHVITLFSLVLPKLKWGNWGLEIEKMLSNNALLSNQYSGIFHW